MTSKSITAALLVAALSLAAVAAQAENRLPTALDLQQSKPASKNWLRDADSDAERFRRIEINERGFAQAMADVGSRFGEFHHAVSVGGYALALYQWERIADAINAGLMRRPGRTRNAEGMFLNGPWKQMHTALSSGDRTRIATEFENARQACMACHVAEGKPFLNDGSVFRRTAALPAE